MLQLPTGGGKTVIGGALLAHWLIDNRKALWLTYRKELAERTRGMLTDAGLSARTNIRWTLGTDAPAMAGASFSWLRPWVGGPTNTGSGIVTIWPASPYPDGGGLVASVFEGLAGRRSRHDWLGNA